MKRIWLDGKINNFILEEMGTVK